jgi:hypothetical protein
MINNPHAFLFIVFLFKYYLNGVNNNYYQIVWTFFSQIDYLTIQDFWQTIGLYSFHLF